MVLRINFPSLFFRDRGCLVEGLILKKGSETKDWTLWRSDTEITTVVPNCEIDWDFSINFNRIYVAMRQLKMKDEREALELVIKDKFPGYWGIREMIWKFMSDHDPKKSVF